MGDYCTPSRGITEIMPPEGHIMPPEGCIVPPEGCHRPEGCPEGCNNHIIDWALSKSQIITIMHNFFSLQGKKIMPIMLPRGKNNYAFYY